MARLLTALRDHLVNEGLVRKPNDAGAAHPLWLEPTLGVPAPGEGQGAGVDNEVVLAAFLTGGIAPDPYGSWHRQAIVDVQLRVAKDRAYLAEDIELAITKALIDRRDWMMSDLYVLESEQWRALQRLGSDEQGYNFVVSFIFELLRP